MKRNLCLPVGVALLVLSVVGTEARADLFVPGSTFLFTYNDPSSGAQLNTNVTFNPNGASTIIDGGALAISEQTLVVDSKTEWVEFYLTTTSGGPLTFYDMSFRNEVQNFQLTEQAGVKNYIFAFTLNGATSGTTDFPGLPSSQDPAPINPPISGNGNRSGG